MMWGGIHATIRSGGLFDGVIDFNKVTLDPQAGGLKPEFVPESTTGGRATSSIRTAPDTSRWEKQSIQLIQAEATGAPLTTGFQQPCDCRAIASIFEAGVRRREGPVRALKQSAFLSLMICVWLAASPHPAAAQDNGLFLFKVCNRSNVEAAVAVVGRESTDSDKFMIHGWYAVGSGQCADLINLPRGWVYFYAEERNPRGAQYPIWPGNDTRLCVDYPGPFERYTGGDTCPSKQLKGFTGRFINQDTGSFTLTLN